MKVVIINYGAGNINSVTHALRRCGVEALLSDDPEAILSADKIIFPGVGEASSAMKSLQAAGLNQLIPELTQPVLGICLGMQLLCKSSEEGNTPCLGVFNAEVRKFHPTSEREKIPHTGWNSIRNTRNEKEEQMYFVHSYYAEICEHTTAVCNYIHHFSAALSYRNFTAVQFHPEKSGEAGERLIRDFLSF